MYGSVPKRWSAITITYFGEFSYLDYLVEKKFQFVNGLIVVNGY